MLLTRRQFLLTIPAVTAGYLTPQFVDKALAYIDNTGEAYLNKPAETQQILYALPTGEDYVLNLGDPFATPDPMTHREAAEYTGYGTDLDSYAYEYLGLEDDETFDPDEEASEEVYFDHWYRHKSSSAQAYWLLEDLDLGLVMNGEAGLDCISFIDGDHPGSSYLGATVPDLVSLSLLQERLNQLNTGIRIKITKNDSL